MTTLSITNATLSDDADRMPTGVFRHRDGWGYRAEVETRTGKRLFNLDRAGLGFWGR